MLSSVVESVDKSRILSNCKHSTESRINENQIISEIETLMYNFNYFYA